LLLIGVICGLQVTVIFLANVAMAVPSPEDWPGVWAEQQAWLKGKAEHEAAVFIPMLYCSEDVVAVVLLSGLR
jgi:hypothetical protein